MVTKVSLAGKFAQFTDHWSPKVVAELNGQEVRVAKLQGEFVWHHHDHEDELFWVAVHGTVEIDDDRERALADIKALARRYGSDPEAFNGQQRATLRVRVDKVVRHDD